MLTIMYAIWGNGYIGSSIIGRNTITVNHGSKMSLPGVEIPEHIEGIIWAAGFPGVKNVDDVERDPIRSKLQNVYEPAELAQRCRKQNKRLLVLSSGCIFDRLNKEGKPHTEEDVPNFTNTVYLRDQMEKERLVLEACPEATIFRIRVPFSGRYHPRNVIYKLSKFDAVWDIQQSYTWIDDLQRAIRAWKEGRIDGGVWHVTQPGTMSNYDLVKNYLNFYVKPITIDVHIHEKMACPRSAAILDSSKLASIITLTPANKAFHIAVKQYIIEEAKEQEHITKSLPDYTKAFNER